MSGGSVLSVSSRALLDACARLGHDSRRIVEAVGIDAATLQDPDARIPADQVDALWRRAYEVSNDPNLALHAVEVLPFGAYRVFDFLTSSAPTVGAAFAKVADYFPLINSGMRLNYLVGPTDVTLTIEAPSRADAITRPYAEYALAAVFLRTRTATGQSFHPRRVEFSHEPPPDTREHERIFGCSIRFGADACRMVIAREIWDTARSGTQPALFAVLDTHARMLLERLPQPDDVVARVRTAIEAELRGGDPGLESIARQLAMSARTLQRRLRDHGVVFNELLDALRFQAAKQYLSQRDIAGSEAAYLLGFADHSSFNRAFKRWSGQTPTEYRRSTEANTTSAGSVRL